ncbi:uncharacterized protein AMSG_12366 [Thecamonas trahens ATCC 50062]|uniref:MIF4G domain-containing protein n=1 Tax=Thecamonas trahens ATCC 50062 TaxID=461836 RepID=A0A0L0DTW5_THETB|nr:hypothetical protein AMSG_12366 [Thecamonas trahens ATCC 50062]KNC54918.1 hypothetical protein AMSG_12366 [Thecamonas trahens ATCC 50062]|eukprot:XP_013753530.1 hypothetical protein AMSG_12366 [Thecamonas trahens ATCC 50062]
MHMIPLYNAKSIPSVIFRRKGSVFFSSRVLGVTAVSTLVAIATCLAVLNTAGASSDDEQALIRPELHALVGFGLTFLLSFRASIAYGCYFEGLTAATAMRAAVTNGVGMALGSLPDTAQRSDIVVLFRILHQSMCNVLRGVTGLDYLARDLVQPAVDFGLAAAAPQTWPAAAAALIKQRLLIRDLDAPTDADLKRINFYRNVSRLYDAVGTAMEAYLAASRVSSTQMPFPFVQALYVILVVFLVTLPLTIVRALGWLTPVALFMISAAFASIDAIAAELDEPFGDEANNLDLGRSEAALTDDITTMTLAVKSVESTLYTRLKTHGGGGKSASGKSASGKSASGKGSGKGSGKSASGKGSGKQGSGQGRRHRPKKLNAKAQAEALARAQEDAEARRAEEAARAAAAEAEAARAAEAARVAKQNADREWVAWRRELYAANSAPVDPEAAAAAKTGKKKGAASVKGNTSFIKKLRAFNLAQRDSLLADIDKLNMSKFVEEIAPVFRDIPLASRPAHRLALEIATELHKRYSPKFASLLADALVTAPQAGSAAGTSGEPPARSVGETLTLLAYLFTAGIVPKLTPVLNGLKVIMAADCSTSRKSGSGEPSFEHAEVLAKFAETFGDELMGVVPTSPPRDDFVPLFSGSRAVASYLLPADEQGVLLKMFTIYHGRAAKHLVQLHEAHLAAGTGSAPPALYPRLSAALSTLCRWLNLAFPELRPREAPSVRASTSFEYVQTTGRRRDLNRGDYVVFRDEDSREFYQSLRDLRAELPAVVFGAPSSLFDDDFPLETSPAAVAASAPALLQAAAPSTASEFERFLVSLAHPPSTRDKLDALALGFCNLAAASRVKRAAFVTHVFGLPKAEHELRLYARIVALVSGACSDVGAYLWLLLRSSIAEALQARLSADNRDLFAQALSNAHFAAHLALFGVIAPTELLALVELAMASFVPLGVEVCVAVVAGAGRLLYASPETQEATGSALVKMRRLAGIERVSESAASRVEAAYYCVHPPDSAILLNERASLPPAHAFFEHVMLMVLAPETLDEVESLFPLFPWGDADDFYPYAVRVLSSVWRFRHAALPDLADLLSALVSSHEAVVVDVIDEVLAMAVEALETPSAATHLQRLSALYAFVGHLFNYELIPTSALFDVLYALVTSGPGAVDPYDTSRVRLVVTLLSVTGEYLEAGTDGGARLDDFALVFKRFVLTRAPLSLDLEHALLELFEWLGIGWSREPAALASLAADIDALRLRLAHSGPLFRPLALDPAVLEAEAAVEAEIGDGGEDVGAAWVSDEDDGEYESDDDDEDGDDDEEDDDDEEEDDDDEDEDEDDDEDDDDEEEYIDFTALMQSSLMRNERTADDDLFDAQFEMMMEEEMVRTVGAKTSGSGGGVVSGWRTPVGTPTYSGSPRGGSREAFPALPSRGAIGGGDSSGSGSGSGPDRETVTSFRIMTGAGDVGTVELPANSALLTEREQAARESREEKTRLKEYVLQYERTG